MFILLFGKLLVLYKLTIKKPADTGMLIMPTNSSLVNKLFRLDAVSKIIANEN